MGIAAQQDKEDWNRLVVDGTFFLSSERRKGRREMHSKRCILIIKIIYLVLVVFLCTAFVHREPSYCKMVDRITKNYLKEFAKLRGMKLSGYGGAMMHDIQSITLHFLSFDSLNIDEARILYVEMMEEFLQRINCHEKIRPHLHNFPFSIDNIKLSIGFEDSERKITQDGHVALMSIAKDHMIYFAAYDPIKNFFLYTL